MFRLHGVDMWKAKENLEEESFVPVGLGFLTDGLLEVSSKYVEITYMLESAVFSFLRSYYN